MTDVNFAELETYLSRFGEGEVILSNKYFEKGIAVVYLNNPGKRNAMSGRMMVKFRRCVEQLEKWKEGKAILLCGLGGNFCSGGDLDFARASGTQREALFMSNWMQDTLMRFKKLPMFSVCLIQGPTLGGGAEISVFADFIIASDDVHYGFVHGKMGIITAWGGTTGLVNKIGYQKALNMLLTSQIINAQKCLELGIAECVVPSQEAFVKALEWIGVRIKHDKTVVRYFKAVAYTASVQSVDNSLEFEKKLFSVTWGSEPNREALSKKIKHLDNSKM